MTEELRRVPREELDSRMDRFRRVMDAQHPSWSAAMIHHKINLYYMTGTMQDGVLVIQPDNAVFWVRRSLTRARKESQFPEIRPMRSFRTLGEFYTAFPERVYVETRTATLEWMERVRKHLPVRETVSVNPVMDRLRARKSPYELDCMRRAGQMHAEVLETVAPRLVREGISEAELASSVFQELLLRGSQGIARFNHPLGEDVIGLCSFGKSGLVTTAFDGPGGTDGTCIAMQSIGSSARRLTRGRMIYLDIPSGFDGYHTDKSVSFYFGKLREDPHGDEIRDAYGFCRQMEQEIAAQLVPGAVPEEIYKRFADHPRIADGFMNGGKFLGHSIGLSMDETPVLARGFREPLQAGMTFAVEPKIALCGVGMIGTENTYVVTERGGECLSGETLPLQEL